MEKPSHLVRHNYSNLPLKKERQFFNEKENGRLKTTLIIFSMCHSPNTWFFIFTSSKTTTIVSCSRQFSTHQILLPQRNWRSLTKFPSSFGQPLLRGQQRQIQDALWGQFLVNKLQSLSQTWLQSFHEKPQTLWKSFSFHFESTCGSEVFLVFL